MDSAHRVVVVGGGFGGLHAAKALRRADVQLTLVDRRNFHLFQPLLYQVATGGLSPADISSPLRAVLRKRNYARVILSEVTDVDAAARRVILTDGELRYETLVVAAGARHHYFGNADWESLAPGLKTIEDATNIRRRVLLAFESAEREVSAERRSPWLTFVIVGGGPTGVELAGALAELARHTLRRDFRAFDPRAARILLVEGSDRVLPTFPPSLSERARRSLERLGVEVRTGTILTALDSQYATMRSGDAEEQLEARTVLWGAGVLASPLGEVLQRATGCPLDHAGRVIVESDLTLPGHPEILVIGDLAHFAHQTGAPLPGIAPVAMSQGRYVAGLVRRRLDGRTTRPFHYVNKGLLATIGRSAAVADFGWLRFSGFPAWLLWLFVHLMYLVEFENRLLVFVQWAYNYFTRKQGARLIAGPGGSP
jgi:NADH dehydrogenase